MLFLVKVSSPNSDPCQLVSKPDFFKKATSFKAFVLPQFNVTGCPVSVAPPHIHGWLTALPAQLWGAVSSIGVAGQGRGGPRVISARAGVVTCRGPWGENAAGSETVGEGRMGIWGCDGSTVLLDLVYLQSVFMLASGAVLRHGTCRTHTGLIPVGGIEPLHSSSVHFLQGVSRLLTPLK